MAATPQQYLIHLQIYKILQTILESHLTSGSTSVASSYAILLLRSAALFSTLHGETRRNPDSFVGKMSSDSICQD